MIRRLALIVLMVAGALRADVDVLLVAASDAELKPVLDRVGGLKTETEAAWTFWTGTIGRHAVALTRSEGDPLNAVVATTLAIRKFAPHLVVVFGGARAHDPALQSGDVVVSERFAAFDGMVSPVTPPGGGSDPTHWVALPHLLMAPGENPVPQMSFPADPKAAAIAGRLPVARGRVVAGVLGSANQVNREADRIAHLRALWGTSCEDFESAHVAGCARLLGVPAVGWRVIDGAPGEAAALVLPFLEAWP